MALALVIGSAQVSAESLQWNSIDGLVDTSNSLVNTFDQGIKAVSGILEYAPVGGIAPDCATCDSYMTEAQRLAYNEAVLNVQADNFTLSASEYLAQQSTQAQDNLGAAVDAYVDAASVLITAVTVNQMASDAQQSGDAVQAQAVQSFVTDNNVLITQNDQIAYNEALDGVELAGETWATIEAVYQDANRVAELQMQADMAGVDFANADDMYLDRFNTVNQSAIVNFTAANVAFTAVVNVEGNLKTLQEVYGAGESGGFYTTGPTQNPCFFNPEDPECVSP